MYNRILVPLDGSDVAEAILSQMEELASKIGAEVILLEILSEAGVLPTTAHQEYNEAKQYLDAIAHRLESKGIKTSATIRYGEPAEEIVDYARTNDVGLIAMSTHGRSGVGRWVFGSVAEKVLRGTALPILLVRAPGVSAYGLPPLTDLEL
jgi:nucleotide-binding universal stress UspA family protein